MKIIFCFFTIIINWNQYFINNFWWISIINKNNINEDNVLKKNILKNFDVKNKVCLKCSVLLSKFELELNRLYPVEKFYCEKCQNRYEKKIIEKLVNSVASDLDFYNFKNWK